MMKVTSEERSVTTTNRGRRPGAHAWSCAVISLVLAASVMVFIGLNWWTAFVVAILLACPLTTGWLLIAGSRPVPFPVGRAPSTRGYTLNWLAPYYDGLCRLVGIGPSFRARTLALAELQQGDHVLDVGCGTGVLTRKAADIVGPVGAAWGVDPAADMIRIAQQNAASARNLARFEPAAAEDLPFPDRSFDAVLLSFVLHHLPGDLKDAGLREMLRVLKPGGRLVAVDIDRPSVRLWWAMVWPLCLVRGPAENLAGRVEPVLRAAGFVDVVRRARWRGIVSLWTARRPGQSSPA
jgi:ubiquinone/menaquinone biosynthesis C-methylase UbiE